MGAMIPPAGQPAAMKVGEFSQDIASNVVQFRVHDVDPPSWAYLQRDDVLFVSVLTATANESVYITIRLLLPTPDVGGQPAAPPAPASVPYPAKGPLPIKTIQFTATGLTPGVVKVFSFQLAEGYLLSVAAFAAIAAQRGITYCRVGYGRGPIGSGVSNVAYALFADYVTQNGFTGWPGAGINYPSSGAGNIMETNIANPAAGADWSYTIPANTRARVKYLQATLVTSSTASNRSVQLQISDNTAHNLFTAPPQQNVPASTTAKFSSAIGQVTSNFVLTDILAPLPADPVLIGGWILSTLTVNLQAGDQWSSIYLVTENWVDGV